MMSYIVFHLTQFLFLKGAHALKHLIPVDKCSVKLRTINTYKLGLAANGQSACSTHTRSVHHDGVERDVGGYTIFLCEQAAELHHDGWTYSKHFVYLFLLDEFLDTHGHHTLFAITAVVGHDNGFIAA